MHHNIPQFRIRNSYISVAVKVSFFRFAVSKFRKIIFLSDHLLTVRIVSHKVFFMGKTGVTDCKVRTGLFCDKDREQT